MSEKRSLSLKIPIEQTGKIKDFLEKEGLTPREVKNTLWSYEGEGLYFNMYASGSLLIQGKDLEVWAEKILQRIDTPEGNIAGCDEVGKGDIFGNLVLCCAVITPSNFREILRLNPKDSKKLKDEEVLYKAKELRKLTRVKCINMSPERFNELYERYKNINRLMDDAYRKLIDKVREEYKPVRVIVDKYSHRNPFQGYREVEFVEKAESDVAVSVASIMARAKFLKALEEMRARHNLEIPKGASSEVKRYAEKLESKNPELARVLIKRFSYGR